MEGQAQANPDPIIQIVSGFWTSQAVNVAARLALPDLLKDGARTVEDLAAETGTHPPSLFRLLRLLASVGFLTEVPPRSFGPTETSDRLRSDVPGSLRWYLMLAAGQEHYTAWGNLLHSVKTGEIAFDHTFQKDVWQHYAENPDCADVFNRAMTGFTEVVEKAVLSSYDFSGFATVVDVGGGHGGMLSSILQKYPQARGVLFDAPQVVADAREVMSNAALQGRVEIAGGDFFAEVPQGGELYILKFILHDWNEGKAAAILHSVRRAIPESGKLLIAEMVLPSGSEPAFSKFMDINMMVMTGGHERTEAGFKSLLATGGFKLARIVATPSMISLIEAEPI
ncbi:MAG: methyltransferase [Acidobacteriota bacterium]